MTEQYTPNLGGVPAEDARRDATHVAVAPVIAGMNLRPGEHVGRSGTGSFVTDMYIDKKELIGVVDPFLKKDVKNGERFWLFLYPGTVTSLRHVWTHPAFVLKPVREY